jgi:hypothetical protein
MTTSELTVELDAIGDALVSVAGELMRRACRDDYEHQEACNCGTCRAFLATHDCQNRLEKIVKALAAGMTLPTTSKGNAGDRP